MNGAVEDEKKPFDVEGAPAVDPEDLLPEPDEILRMDSGGGRVWAVKIPKFLMERWASIDKEDVHLASIRIYGEAKGSNGKSPRIVLFLPPRQNATPEERNDPTRPTFGHNAHVHPLDPESQDTAEPDCYDLDMINDSVFNQVVVAERPFLAEHGQKLTPAQKNPRARTTFFSGRIKHDCNLRPVFSERYRRQMKERTRAYNTPKRTLVMIDNADVPGGRGGINQLSSAVQGSNNSFQKNFIKAKKAGKDVDRMVRMPRDQLMDQLFALFKEQPRWPIAELRKRTEQPLAYLKEVLGDIGVLGRSGESNGLWELQVNFREGSSAKREDMAGPSSLRGEDVKMEVDGEDEDEDEDDDMEEV